MLSWSHYLKLVRIEDPNERAFYEIEAQSNHWSLRELQRQFDSSLYERLALSRIKAETFVFDPLELRCCGSEGEIRRTFP